MAVFDKRFPLPQFKSYAKVTKSCILSQVVKASIQLEKWLEVHTHSRHTSYTQVHTVGHSYKKYKYTQFHSLYTGITPLLIGVLHPGADLQSTHNVNIVR